jgi:hypothetical protein
MPALVAGMTAFGVSPKKGLDDRDKPADDG